MSAVGVTVPATAVAPDVLFSATVPTDLDPTEKELRSIVHSPMDPRVVDEKSTLKPVSAVTVAEVSILRV